MLPMITLTNVHVVLWGEFSTLEGYHQISLEAIPKVVVVSLYSAEYLYNTDGILPQY